MVLIKNQILELYLNSVYFGHGTYGIQAASVYYYGKDEFEIKLIDKRIPIQNSSTIVPNVNNAGGMAFLNAIIDQRFDDSGIL